MISLAVLFSTADLAYAKPSFPPEAKALVVKFSLAMIGVFVFSVLIMILLSLYNKFFVSPQLTNFEEKKDSLRSFEDKDEAILNFVTKNRLK
jgi:hypothetical protein